MKIAAIGECLIELTERSANLMARHYAGDTYNTCYYLAQLKPEWRVAYVTAIGVDPHSQAMLKTWRDHRIETALCLQFDDKIPGLYLVNTDEHGERSFCYYRHQSAASQLFSHPLINQRLETLLTYDYLYVSGISFAILSPGDRQRLFEFIKLAKQHGVGIIYDNNYREKLWPNPKDAQSLAEQLCPLTDVFFVTQADEALLFGDADAKETCQRYQAWSLHLLVVKDGSNPCLVSEQGQLTRQYPPRVKTVVDTTGAGDAFNAGFLIEYWQDGIIHNALKQGHQLASGVIQCQGALMPLGQVDCSPY